MKRLTQARLLKKANGVLRGDRDLALDDPFRGWFPIQDAIEQNVAIRLQAEGLLELDESGWSAKTTQAGRDLMHQLDTARNRC